MSDSRSDETELKTAALRVILTDEALRVVARVKAERRIVELTPGINGKRGTTTKRSVPDREVYELIISALLEEERAGKPLRVLYPPESARRRQVWIDARIKAELDEAAKRLDVSVGALFFTATQAFIESTAIDTESQPAHVN